ncbi:MAG: hypothetical protein L6Q33_10635 [Bacteriovoracaceae bacterium]|nr:hypothetical protein [Bacteriovoracaceae bacterium]
MKAALKLTIFLTFLGLLMANNSLGHTLTSLNAEELIKLKKGEVVTVTFPSEEFKNAPWPVVKVYQLIDATPLQAVSLFGALDYQEKYIPKTLKSDPIKHISSTEVLTEYEIEVPFPLQNATHVHGSLLKKLPNGHELSWYRVSSNSTEEAKGFARFTSHENKTLMEYQTFIIPKSIFGALVKKIMVKDVTNTVVAIKNHVEKLAKENHPILKKYVEFTEKSYKGENVYQSEIELNTQKK